MIKIKKSKPFLLLFILFSTVCGCEPVINFEDGPLCEKKNVYEYQVDIQLGDFSKSLEDNLDWRVRFLWWINLNGVEKKFERAFGLDKFGTRLITPQSFGSFLPQGRLEFFLDVPFNLNGPHWAKVVINRTREFDEKTFILTVGSFQKFDLSDFTWREVFLGKSCEGVPIRVY